MQVLLQATGYRESTFELAEVNAFAQQHWLRPPGLERWQMQPKWALTQAQRQVFEAQLGQLGLTAEVAPQSARFEYAVVLGATAATMRERFAYLVQLWRQRRVVFQQLVFWVGQRPLDAQMEPQHVLLGKYPHTLQITPGWRAPTELPRTETAAARLIYEQAQLPAALRRLPVTFVDVPLQSRGGQRVRPNTADTVRGWLQLNPRPGKVLALSSNPFVGYQDAVLRGLLPDAFPCETIGPGPSRQDRAPRYEVMLDSLARILYELHQRSKAS